MSEFEREDDTTSIYFSLKRTALILLVNTLLFGIGGYLMLQEKPLFGAIGLSITAMVIGFFLWIYARRHLPALILTPDGLTICMTFSRKRDVYCRWSDIVNIHEHQITSLGFAKAIFINTLPKAAYYRNHPAKTVNSRLLLAAICLQGGNKAILKQLHNYHKRYANPNT